VAFVRASHDPVCVNGYHREEVIDIADGRRHPQPRVPLGPTSQRRAAESHVVEDRRAKPWEILRTSSMI
jgi:hypothetical protein